MKTTIAKKIALAFLILFLLMLVTIYVVSKNFVTTSESIGRIEHEASKRFVLDNIRYNTSKSLMDVNDYIITEDLKYKNHYEESRHILSNNITLLNGLEIDGDEKRMVGEISRALDSVYRYADLILAYKNPRQSDETPKLMETMDYKFGDTVYEKIDSLFVIMFNKFSAEFLKVQENRETSLRNIYLLSIGAVIIGITVLILTIYRITKPLNNLKKAVDLFSKGDFSYIPEHKSFDEITEISSLTESFKKMAEIIRTRKEP